MHFTLLLPLSLAALAAAQNTNTDPGFPLSAVKEQMLSKASHSWEWGTAAEALLELDAPALSVFGAPSLPLPAPLPAAADATLSYITPHISLSGDTLTPDGSVGDPASLGVFALMAGGAYADAANRQQHYLVATAPRWDNGAISHRADAPNLWADFVYMAPPFLAFHAASTGDGAALAEAVRQCGLYRDVLGGGGAWRHITGPEAKDDGHWSTGNGWAAAGMARVLATVRAAKGDADDQAQLKTWIGEILRAAMDAGRGDRGLLRNYLDDAGWFGEVSGTALLAAAALRVHVIDSEVFGDDVRAWAEESYGAVAKCVGDDGVVGPAVNPLNWQDRSESWDSPEAQAATVLMYAAWRDCVDAGKCQGRTEGVVRPRL
ncbi:hypothetical protein EDC01DRAFT_430315 [Geopyxis carbonaria]|nr:hypothetical protein EDC01DRAFT_430315 [Geopyxis carbonaria]